MVMVALLSLLLSLPAASDQAEIQGKEEFELGTQLFRTGDYLAALEQFKRSYERSAGRPTVILALAQCERALGHVDAAIERFNEYLATPPGEQERASIEATIAALERERPKAEVSISPPSQPAPQPSVLVAPMLRPRPDPGFEATPEAADNSVAWVWWVSAGVAAVGTGVLIFALTQGSPAPYGGTSGLILDPGAHR